jgi:hypothetical protein
MRRGTDFCLVNLLRGAWTEEDTAAVCEGSTEPREPSTTWMEEPTSSAATWEIRVDKIRWDFLDRYGEEGRDFLNRLDQCVRGWERVFPNMFRSWVQVIGRSQDSVVRQVRGTVGKGVVGMLHPPPVLTKSGGSSVRVTTSRVIFLF